MEKFIKTSLKDIKVIIFDFDETLYYSSNIREYYINYIFNTIKTLTKVKDWTDFWIGFFILLIKKII